MRNVDFWPIFIIVASKCAYDLIECGEVSAVKKHLRIDAEKSVRRTLLLAAFLLLGMVLAFALAGTLPQEELQYLQDYVARRRESLIFVSGSGGVWQILWEYLRYIVLLAAVGYCTANPVPILLLCTAQGFSLSFAVAAFVQAMGWEGLLLALSTLGLRCLVSLPLSIYLAGVLLEQALGQKRDPKHLLRSSCLCLILALLGAVCEVFLCPVLLRYFFA